MDNTTDKVRENRARRWANRHGLILRKSRAQMLSVDNLGGYMLVDAQLNAVVAGSRFDLGLADVEAILRASDAELQGQSPG